MTEMTLHTPLCDLLDIKYPILLAGMGGVSCPELAAAVSNAGGLGILGAATCPPNELSEWIQRTRKLTSQPFGVDTLLPVTVPSKGSASQFRAELPQKYLDFVRAFKERHGIPDPDPAKARTRGTMAFSQDFFRKQIEVVLDERVPVYVAGLGNPAFMAADAHGRGIKVMAIAGNVKHARRFKEGGIDIIVAQGTDGGGHTGRIGTLTLIPQVIDAVSPTPVVAAGGIGDGRGLVAALALGAVGVWCGTPFLATHEANIDDYQKEVLIEADEESTVVSRSVTGKTARMLKNKWAEEFDASGIEALPMPYQALIAMPVIEGARQAQIKEVAPGIAGQSVGLIKRIRPAREVVEGMVREAIEILEERLPRSARTH